MNETLYSDVFGDTIVLSDTVRSMVFLKHPEVSDFIDKVASVLAQPDEVRRSIRDERVIIYYRFEANVLNGKWVAVVVKRVERNYVSTIYATDQIKSGEILWTKNT